jgi:hypothetical protein
MVLPCTLLYLLVYVLENGEEYTGRFNGLWSKFFGL